MVAAGDESDLAIGRRARRHRIDGIAGRSGFERQHLERVPAEHPFPWRQPRLAPIRINLWRIRATVHLAIGNCSAQRVGKRRRLQSIDQDGTSPVHQCADRMHQLRARIAEQAAPIAGMVCALSGSDRELKRRGSAGAEENRRPVQLQPRSVAGNQYVGAELVFVLLRKLPQSAGADLLARFDQHAQVKAQIAAARLQHRH